MSLWTFSLLGSREALNFGARYLGEKVERPKSYCRERNARGQLIHGVGEKGKPNNIMTFLFVLHFG
jgi:hypothetical protein